MQSVDMFPKWFMAFAPVAFRSTRIQTTADVEKPLYATVANAYLAMYPTPLLARALKSDKTLRRKVWRVLNAISTEQLLSEGRVWRRHVQARSLSDLENRSENSRNRDQILMDLRRIAGLFNEKPWGYGPISRICSRLMSKSDRLLEPKELANVDATAIAELIPGLRVESRPEQLTMFG